MPSSLAPQVNRHLRCCLPQQARSCGEPPGYPAARRQAARTDTPLQQPVPGPVPADSAPRRRGTLTATPSTCSPRVRLSGAHPVHVRLLHYLSKRRALPSAQVQECHAGVAGIPAVQRPFAPGSLHALNPKGEPPGSACANGQPEAASPRRVHRRLGLSRDVRNLGGGLAGVASGGESMDAPHLDTLRAGCSAEACLTNLMTEVVWGKPLGIGGV